MQKILLTLLLALLCTTSHADNCEAIGSQIEARMRAGGLPAPRLISVDHGTAVGGRVVGSCANGRKLIVLVAGSGVRAAAPTDNIMTECKDGRVVRGPDCSKPPPRPKPASAPEIATAATPAPAP